MKKRALISVSDKSNLVDFAQSLIKHDFEIISSGGTAHFLSENGIEVIPIEQITEFPEIMGGRVKTLHPKIHGGILARKNIDEEIAKKLAIQLIDIVVVNLYPFKQTIANPEVTLNEAVEQIDIGGPAMVRAAAKNFERVLTVVDPSDYEEVTGMLNQSYDMKKYLAFSVKAFKHTSAYDETVANYLMNDIKEGRQSSRKILQLEPVLKCNYGENPHQEGSYFNNQYEEEVPIFAQGLIQGKPLSYNNLADADAALRCLKEFNEPTCVIVKHANPSGVATTKTVMQSYQLAYEADPTSAFGGIIALNDTVTKELADQIINQQFFEIILAPKFEKDALQSFSQKPKARVIEFGPFENLHIPTEDYKRIIGGFLIQGTDLSSIDRSAMKVVTDKHPNDNQLNDLVFAWKVCKHVKSNAIVIAENLRTTGIGAGQMSRIMSTKIAASQTKLLNQKFSSLILASDAFFPFPDNVEIAYENNIQAIIQPGGSIKDHEVIQKANELGMIMIFTGVRNFKH